MSVISRSLLAATSVLGLTAGLAGGPAHAAADNTPVRAIQSALDRGPADPAQVVTVTVHLAPADTAAFHKAVDALYDPASPTFHHWMTNADLARYAPPASHMAAVRAALERQGLAVVSTDRSGFSVRARGPLGNVSRAFGTDIHAFERGGVAFRANTRNAALAGIPAEFVSSVAGIENHPVRPTLTRAVNPRTNKPLPNVPVAQALEAGGLKSLITPEALSAPETVTYTTPGQALPTATYSGSAYDRNANLTVDFDAHALQRAYGLEAAYKQSLDGTGQTIVLLEGYGYPTAEADANTSAKLNHLPPFDHTNFKVVYPQGKPVDPRAGILVGWNGEIALDIQSAHAIAPGAKILVVASNGQDGEDFQAAMQSIIDDGLGTAVSDSWEEDTDLIAGPSEQESYEDILTMAAAKGISFQFSTGDGGDGGLGTPLGAPGVPSVSPHATAVGGTALLNNVGTGGYTSVGWGDAIAELDVDGPIDPPFTFFYAGGGGGESVFWPKPSWQASLPGTGRQEPDISALADPFTGFPIVLTEGKQQVIEPGVGGTSLASPIFTAFWVLAQQKAGHPLGQASPIIASLTTGVTDVVPVTAPQNLSGSVTDGSGTTEYSTKKLFKGLFHDGQLFPAALWDIPQDSEGLGIAFSLDSSLTVTSGWDNATGYGTPDGLNFINAVAAYGQ